MGFHGADILKFYFVFLDAKSSNTFQTEEDDLHSNSPSVLREVSRLTQENTQLSTRIKQQDDELRKIREEKLAIFAQDASIGELGIGRFHDLHNRHTFGTLF